MNKAKFVLSDEFSYGVLTDCVLRTGIRETKPIHSASLRTSFANAWLRCCELGEYMKIGLSRKKNFICSDKNQKNKKEFNQEESFFNKIENIIQIH
jgi:hypothetical protein